MSYFPLLRNLLFKGNDQLNFFFVSKVTEISDVATQSIIFHFSCKNDKVSMSDADDDHRCILQHTPSQNN